MPPRTDLYGPVSCASGCCAGVSVAVGAVVVELVAVEVAVPVVEVGDVVGDVVVLTGGANVLLVVEVAQYFTRSTAPAASVNERYPDAPVGRRCARSSLHSRICSTLVAVGAVVVLRAVVLVEDVAGAPLAGSEPCGVVKVGRADGPSAVQSEGAAGCGAPMARWATPCRPSGSTPV